MVWVQDTAGAKGGRTDALKLFTFSCLSFAYMVVGGLGAPDGLGALKLLFFLGVFLIHMYW